MPKNTVQNPLYTGRYNDPNLAAAAQNIAGLLLGGQSPNDAALAASEAELREAQTVSGHATARKTGLEGDLLQYTVDDLGNPLATSGRNVADLLQITDPNQRAIYNTLRQSRINIPADVGQAERDNFDWNQALTGQPTPVAERRSAMEGTSPFDFSNEQVRDKFAGTTRTTDIGRQKIATDAAQAESYRAAGRESDADARKADRVPKPKPGGGKAMPASILKQYNAANEALKKSQSSISALDDADRLFSTARTDKDGKTIGPIDTGIVSRGVRLVTKNVGGGTENTRGLGELDRLRETLRANYMLLAKGVQTNRDAENAMNMMMPYTTDPLEIQQQLRDVREATTALIDAHQSSFDNITAEYGFAGGVSDAAPQPPARSAPAGFDADKERRYQEWKARQGAR